MNLLKRDFKFGIDKSKRNILVFIIFIVMPLIVCINFYKDYSYVVSYLILPKLDTRENIFGSNIFFVYRNENPQLDWGFRLALAMRNY